MVHQFQVGDEIQIKAEWQDAGDEKFKCFVVEAPKESDRVRIVQNVFEEENAIQPTEWISVQRITPVAWKCDS